MAQTDPMPSPDDTPAFPTETQTVAIGAREFAAGGITASRIALINPHHSVLHIRFNAPKQFAFLSVTPTEVALGPGESQSVAVRVDTLKARAAVTAGASANGYIEVAYQRLYPASRAITPSSPQVGTITVRLPFANCPNCKRSLEGAIAAGEIDATPEYCPYCFERLRPCPVCGTLNSWMAFRCVQDPTHKVRQGPDWGTLGGSPAHIGSIEEKAATALVRRWSFPTVPPTRREAALNWSAPACSYGIVAAGAATYDGEAHIYAFDGATGAPLWDAYPLPDPVYPDRGGVAIAGGRIYAATVEGVCVAVDAQRGTRLWETSLVGRVYGAVTPAGDNGPLLVAVIDTDARGILYFLDAETGEVLRKTPLPGPSDTTPAFADGVAFIHDDGGNVCAIDVKTGEIRWTAACGAGFDSSPVVRDGYVFSLTVSGAAWCHEVATGKELWHHTVTNAPFAGTPAHDGTLLYMPANDGLHLFSAVAGKPVRRYPMRMPVRSAPVVAGGTLFFGATDGNIYAASAGRQLEKVYETVGVGSQFVAAPAYSEGTLYAASTNGVLYAVMQVPPLPPGPAAANPQTGGASNG